ncbi:TM2 domain-containing protein [Chengkuizengella axinellae]|uniref:TM2 domain-containing protein n=1 Tax=Chengkuizengella axinellae TaxID=3064388 RepID=A0ABT9J2Z9_9BACL|nr:TM2 domain-containing protein [Chengkuizengella sp. 2205SS18-9]MDP5276006.1 TM2 domain-containing protein [Chengkuizengella sp. 2205SS18-9]
MSLFQKQGLSTEELQLLNSEMLNKQKASGVTWLLWFFAGGFGGHRFYLGKTGTAVAMLFTFGGIGIWTLIDLFRLNGMIKTTNEQIENGIISEIRLLKNAENNTSVSV